MLQSAGTDIVPLDSLWGSSGKMVWEILPGNTGSTFPTWCYLCAALAIILILSRKLSPLFSNIITNFPKPLPRSRELSLPVALSFLAAAVICSILISGFLCYLSIIPVSGFRSCTVLILSALAAKSILLVLIREVSGEICFMSFIRAFIIMLAGLSFIVLTVSLTTWLFPGTDGQKTASYILIVLISLSILVYLYKISITLFSAGISPFYSFLYLCTVEIVPLCLAASLISRL